MKKEVTLLLDKGERALKAAGVLFENGDYDFAASRTYYAMFYVAEAALLSRDKTFSKHAGVISGFYHEFVASGQLPQDLHRSFHRAFEDRALGDYSFMDTFPREDAEGLLGDANAFIREVKKILLA